jgi:hypothetical protein
VSFAPLFARVSHDTLRWVLYQKVPWSRRLWDVFAQVLVRRGGYLVITDTSWERFTRVADTVSRVWSKSNQKGLAQHQHLRLNGPWRSVLSEIYYTPEATAAVKALQTTESSLVTLSQLAA